MGRRIGQALTAVLLAAALLLGGMPAALAVSETSLQIGVMADPHYYTKALAGGYNEEFRKNEMGIFKLFMQSEGIVDSALAGLAAHAKHTGRLLR